MDLFDVSMNIERVQLLQGHAEYIIRANFGVGDVVIHTNDITTRYSDLEEAFDAKLRALGVSLDYPPKKVFGSMNREFIAERQVALQKYLDSVCSNLFIITSPPFQSFFCPQNIRPKHDEQAALTHLSVLFRSNPGWSVVRQLSQVGWRSSRYVFEVKSLDPSLSNGQYFGSWTEHFAAPPNGSAINAQSINDLKLALRYVQSVRHPYVAPLVHSIVDELGALCIRSLSPIGSLRDLVHNLRPQTHLREPFLRKYWNVTRSTQLPVLPIPQIRSVGRQILEALVFLLDKSIPFGHLHAGNVLVTNVTSVSCQLTDLEDFVLGVTPFHTWNARRLHRVVTLENMTVFAFGHTLYECIFGRLVADRNHAAATTGSLAHPEVPRMLTELLERLITRDGVRQGLPTLLDLLANPIFQNAPQPDLDAKRHRNSVSRKSVGSSNDEVAVDPNLVGAAKMTESLKRILDAAQSRIEDRLKEEQRLMAIQRRKSKAESRQSLSTLIQESGGDLSKQAREYN